MHSILVTGGAGFIGRNLVDRLLSSSEGSYKVIVIDNLSSHRNNCHSLVSKKLLEHNNRFEFYQEDIRNITKVSDILKHKNIGTCIHLAAKSSVVNSIKNPVETMDVNVGGTLSLLEVCSRYKISNFIFASSAAVYGKPLELPLSEQHPLGPLSPYATSKVAGEALVSSYRNSGSISNAISLRIFNVYGLGQNPSYAGVITKFARRLSRKLAPMIYGDGKQTRDFISVHDVVSCMVLAMRAQNKGKLLHLDSGQGNSLYPVGALNVGTGTATTLNSLANKMIEISGLDTKPVHLGNARKSGEVRHSYANTTKTAQVLKFKAAQKLEGGLKKILRASSIRNE
jgi:UDP-glucose 4-epimerase